LAYVDRTVLPTRANVRVRYGALLGAAGTWTGVPVAPPIWSGKRPAVDWSIAAFAPGGSVSCTPLGKKPIAMMSPFFGRYFAGSPLCTFPFTVQTMNAFCAVVAIVVDVLASAPAAVVLVAAAAAS
jgi:hypothetical protein